MTVYRLMRALVLTIMLGCQHAGSRATDGGESEEGSEVLHPELDASVDADETDADELSPALDDVGVERDDGAALDRLPRGRIVYVSQRDGMLSLWNIASDGSDPIRLTPAEPYEAALSSPRWSPAGTQVAFARLASGKMQIFVVDADGTDERQLTKDDEDNLRPVWAPDGTRLMFVCRRHEMRSGYPFTVGHLCTVTTDGAQKVMLDDATPPAVLISFAFGGSFPIGVISIDWRAGSPELLLWVAGGGDGAIEGKYGSYKLMTTTLTGGDLRTRVEPIPFYRSTAGARWAPANDEFIASVGNLLATGATPRQLVTGANLTPIFDEQTGYYDEFPSWTRDGRHIVFQSNRSGRTQLHWTSFDPDALPMDPARIRQLTSDVYENTEPDFYEER